MFTYLFRGDAHGVGRAWRTGGYQEMIAPAVRVLALPAGIDPRAVITHVRIGYALEMTRQVEIGSAIVTIDFDHVPFSRVRARQRERARTRRKKRKGKRT